MIIIIMGIVIGSVGAVVSLVGSCVIFFALRSMRIRTASTTQPVKLKTLERALDASQFTLGGILAVLAAVFLVVLGAIT